MTSSPNYPFVAIVGQQRLKLALILNTINPTLSGVLIRGEKGTAKSTAVRALADILPAIRIFTDDPFNLSPETEADQYARIQEACGRSPGDSLPPVRDRRVPVVELPVGATEDRVVGTLDLEQALVKGQKRVEPGLLAAAHRGILYVDEVNLLDDHVVDVLLDSAAMGTNTLEREGISFSHPARFTLVGTMNPEEGELRPQLLDRFGLCVQVEAVREAESRVAIMERRTAYEADPAAFCARWQNESLALAQRIEDAMARCPGVTVDRPMLFEIANYCLDVGVDGHRGDIVMLKAAKTLAAFEGRGAVTTADIATAAELALPHRVRRQPMQEIGSDVARLRQAARRPAAGGL